jgi:hypothetical protein
MRTTNPLAVFIFFLIAAMGGGIAYAVFRATANPQTVAWIVGTLLAKQSAGDSN